MADAGEQHQASALQDGYEQLRSAVLGGQPDGFRLGHGVLAARGLAAWMQRPGQSPRHHAPLALTRVPARSRHCPAPSSSSP